MATRKPAAAAMTAAKKPAAKTPAKPAKQSNKWASVQLPDGYTAIVNGDYGQEWDFEEMPLLVGVVVGDIREVEAGKGRDKRMQRVIALKNEADGITYTVWDSASLRGWFDVIEDGSEVAVAFQGYRDVGKASLMKVFIGSIVEQEKPARRTAAKKR